jgi:murein DD-endopeptidase MepM/ murein hydrolase activator NlpD
MGQMSVPRVLILGAGLSAVMALAGMTAAQTPAPRGPSAQAFASEAAALRRQSEALDSETRAMGSAVTALARAQVLRQEAMAWAQAELEQAEAKAQAAQAAADAEKARLESLVMAAWFARRAGATGQVRAGLRFAAGEAAEAAVPATLARDLEAQRLAHLRQAQTRLAAEAARGELRLADLSSRLAARSADHGVVLERIELAEARARTLRRDPAQAGAPAPRLAAALFGSGGARTVLGAARGRPGVTYAGAPGQLVVSPGRGRVRFSGPFHTFESVLILELDSGYAIVFSGLDGATAAVGTQVRAGEVIGRFSSDAAVAPELYVEVRQSTRPVDPERAARMWTVASVGVAGR